MTLTQFFIAYIALQLCWGALSITDHISNKAFVVLEFGTLVVFLVILFTINLKGWPS